MENICKKWKDTVSPSPVSAKIETFYPKCFFSDDILNVSLVFFKTVTVIFTLKCF